MNNQYNHKRSRWGNNNERDYARSDREGSRQSRSNKSAGMKSGGVTDEEALNALLSSAGTNQNKGGKESRNYRYNDHKNRGGSNSMERHTDSGHYGPSSSSFSNQNKRQRRQYEEEQQPERQQRWGRKDDNDSNANKDKTDESNALEEAEKEKPNFGLSGNLAKDENQGNVYKGVLLKFKEPPEARAPNTQWRFYVFKNKKHTETLHISKQSAYLFGRDSNICDIPILHGSCSTQHAVLQYRAVPVQDDNVPPGQPPRLQCRPYLMDLESTNGTFINGTKIESARYYQLKKGDVLKFGASTREYVILTENTTSIK